jgi:hypothetical protein
MRTLPPVRVLQVIGTICATLLALVSCIQVHPQNGSLNNPVRMQTMTIDNSQPQRDDAGNIVDAHDGCLQFFAGRYYLYGTAYGRSSGFSINNRFRVYSSPDLQHWTLQGELLKSPPDGVYYRPYVVFNPYSRKYVLFYNWYPKLWDGKTAVAVSDTPEGPFTITNPDLDLSQKVFQPGDGSPFVDEDGTCYFIYTVIGQSHAVRIEQLTRDYLASTGKFSQVLAINCEAPVLFRRGNYYYALMGQCCCFCSDGTDAKAFTASSPLGPFLKQGNINCPSTNEPPTVAGQETWVAQLPGEHGFVYIWLADRWHSAEDGVKGHDCQFWAPLQFQEDGAILPIKNCTTWEATLRAGQGSIRRTSHYFWAKKRDPNPLANDPCTGEPLDPSRFDGLE